MANQAIKVNLLKLKGATVLNLKGKHETKRCLVIPVDDANLYVGEKGVYLDLIAFERKTPSPWGDDTHIAKQSLDAEVREAMSEEERNAQPVLGSLTPIKHTPREMEVTTTLDGNEAVEGDLPF